MERHKPSVVEISSDVFGVVYAEDDSPVGGFGANQGFIILENSVLVFDSGFTPQIAGRLDIAVSKLTDKRVRYLVNSHGHTNHTRGNSFFSRRYSTKGLTIISHSNCAELVRRLDYYDVRNQFDLNRSEPDSRRERSISSIEYFNVNLQVSIEGTELLFAHPENGAHTLGDTMLFIPKKGTIFAGDLVYNSYFPNLQEAHIDSWVDTIRQIDPETYRKCLPGHGQICSTKGILEFAEYLNSLMQKLRTLDLREIRKEEIRSCFETEGTEKWKLRTAIDRNIASLSGRFGHWKGSSEGDLTRRNSKALNRSN